VKKQTFVVLVALFSFVGSAFGLGLGEIVVRSNLNEPLVAEIQLIQLQGLTAGEVLPTLAGNDDFRRAGVERSFFLSNIQFRVKENDGGDIVVSLATRQTVREPFLNFLVEINWPGGRLLKEYTILLDPPVFDTGLAVDALVVQPSQAAAATELQTSTVIRDNATEQVAVKAPVTPRDDNLPAGQYRVKRNDTLWEIALDTPSGQGFSPQQVMLAIQDLNPKAFLNNNINRVKAGSVLTLPDSQQIAQRTLDQAISEVKAQNNGAAPKLRAPVGSNSDVQLSASETTSSALPVGGESKNPDGYLELTSDSESVTTTAAGDVSAKVDQLQNQLFVAEELNDQFALEKNDLQSRVSELQEQIVIMERLLDIQNSGLAEVQQALVQTDTAQAVSTPIAEPEPVVVEPAPVAVAPVVTPVAVPVAPIAQAPDTLMDRVSAVLAKAIAWVMASVTNMAIVGLAALMVILLPFYIRSKRSSDDKTLSELTESVDEIEDIEDFNADFDEDLLAEVEEEFEEASKEEFETLDGVVEAEMYLAYQKYDQAEEKLKEAYSEHPERSDIGLKLLEVYAETGDAKAFAELEERLSLSNEQKYQASQLRAKLPLGSSGGDDILADGDLMVSGLDLDLEEDEVLPVSDDFDLDFDDLDAEPTDTTNDAVAEYTIDELSLDTESDSDLMGSALDTYAVADSDAFSNDLDFSLDLGDLEEEPLTTSTLDFSKEEAVEAVTPAAVMSEPDHAADNELVGLDFSLDLDDDIEESTTKSLYSSELELDLSADHELDLSDSDLDLDLAVDGELDLSVDDALDLSADTELDLSSDDELELSGALDLSDELSGEDDPFAGLGDFDLSNEALLEGEAGDDSLSEPSLDDVELASDAIEGYAEDLAEPVMDPLQQLTDSLDSDAELEEDEFDFLSGSDEASTKLDLARAYIEMDDKEGARDILDEVVTEGNDDQKAQAQELIGQL
jgi:pilus assembly protein FimV